MSAILAGLLTPQGITAMISLGFKIANWGMDQLELKKNEVTDEELTSLRKEADESRDRFYSLVPPSNDENPTPDDSD
ncbi:MAG: hypothetical protein DRP09_20565 [Candidatus Thorarchaeota archaeon]|nr:MAG: hypothetical protein DRP09_20565 [Candidatus Thorarchaeota archaeon]